MTQLYFGWADLPWLLWALLLDALGVKVTTAPRAVIPSAVGRFDGRPDISLSPGPTPAPKRSEPPEYKVWALALQKLENLVVIGAVTVGWQSKACSFEQWLTVIGLVCGLATFGPKLATLTRGPSSIGALIAYWWSR